MADSARTVKPSNSYKNGAKVLIVSKVTKSRLSPAVVLGLLIDNAEQHGAVHYDPFYCFQL